MAKPLKLPEWDTTQVNSIEPDQDHKDEGWLAPDGVPEKPPFQTFNWWQNAVYRWISFFDDIGKVIIRLGAVELVHGRVNELRDNGPFTLPLANTIEDGEFIEVELISTYADFEPAIFAQGTDIITYKDGNDTDLLITAHESTKIRFTSNGDTKWRI